ncbi:MAG: AbgT family transporter [Sandarakinorhabdus sp.]|nr:AbgT family transporter [Sandarakinorhabdus sp.]
MMHETADGAARPLSWIERAGKAVPDPVVLFMMLWVIVFAASVIFGGYTFQIQGPGGDLATHAIKPMHHAEHVRWIFDNAILANWLAFGGGVIGIILFIIMAVGVAEHVGLLGALIKRAGAKIPERYLGLAVVFLGIMSSLASDAGYLILVPLAGLLYASLGRHPLIGMAAAFAGVSAGFSANLIPGTASDVIVGLNARAFAEAAGVPFTNADGQPLNPATMNYWFTAASTFVLAPVGAWVTHRFVARRLERVPYDIPADLNVGEFRLTEAERRGLRASALGLLIGVAFVAAMAFGPLAAFENPETGQRVVPYLERLVLLIGVVFILCGTAFGIGAGTIRSVMDVVEGMVRQMNTMGYIIVLSFFAYNALSLFTYSGLGVLLSSFGATGLVSLGLQDAPILLLIAFILLTATINLMIGGLTSKWLLLGPVFVPMLYAVNPAMTPDVVAAAYRVGDSPTNIITPMMTYAGVILVFMRRYVPGYTLGEMFILMAPYAFIFLAVWTVMFITWISLGIPLGF